MPEFAYKAISDSGNIIEEVIEASNIGVVSEKLSSLGYIPLQIKEHRSNEIKLFNKKEKVKHDEIVLFTKQLVTLLKAGVPFLTSLEALSEQASSDALKDIIHELYASVESGKSFSESLLKHKSVFNNLYVSSIRAGELSGSLDDVLDRLVFVLEHEKETRDKIRSAMRYPIIVICALVVAFVVLIMVVVPKFTSMFEKLGADLPIPTKIMIMMNNLFQNYGLHLLGGLIVIGIIFFKWKTTSKGKEQWDEILLKMPLFGDLILKNAMSRFAKMFETLNRSGLPILKTLEIVAETVGNLSISREIGKISTGVERGEGIAYPMKRSYLFPPMVVRMISIGEQSGSLDNMLNNVSMHYDSEVDFAIKKLTGSIEPILTITIGVFIMFLALSIFMPMWNMMGAMQ